MTINIKNISKSYNKKSILNNINLQINDGELVALLGPSGSGKTTLLRVIAGIEKIDSGIITNSKGNIYDQDIYERDIGFVFQHYALFKHMSVFENIAFGLRMQQKKLELSNEAINSKVKELINLIKLESFKNSYPRELSGGQQQRVALARSLAIEPKILLLDEPFGALDAKIRKKLRIWIRHLSKKLRLTIVFVTHDQEEAMEIADRVVIMNGGIIEQVGTPTDVYQNPSNSFVYDFLGNFNVFLGWKNNDNEIRISEYLSIDNVVKRSGWFKKGKFISNIFKLLKTSKDKENKHSAKGNYVEIFVRPHDIEVTKQPDSNYEYIPVVLVHFNAASPTVKLDLEKNDSNIIYAEMSHEKFNNLKLSLEEKLFIRATSFTVYE